MRGILLIASLLFCILSPMTQADEQTPKSIEESPGGEEKKAADKRDSELFTPNQKKSAQLHTEFEQDSQTTPDIAITLLGQDILRGRFERLYWTAGQAVAGLAMPTPVLVAAGVEAGPTLCLTAAVHGDELNGVETIRRVMFSLESDQLKGIVIGVPIVNMHGFRRSSRYLPDRRDLNRYFPGDPKGSSAGRIAHSFFNEIIAHCDRLIDIHTGSFHRTNLTQLRSDLGKESVKEFSKMFHDVTVLDGAGATGTLRKASVDAGIPAVTLEAGEPLRLQLREVTQSVNGIRAVMHHMNMINDKPQRSPKQNVYYKSTWLRADQSGVFLTEAKLGQKVKKGDILGNVTDPITNRSSVIRSNVDGQIIGIALNQMVMPGFAAYHVGINTDERQVAAEKVADSVVAEALEPVAEELKEAAREAAQSAAKQTNDPKEVNAAVRKAVKAAAQSTPKIVEDKADAAEKNSDSNDQTGTSDDEADSDDNTLKPNPKAAKPIDDELSEHPE
jgi:predicted deacylase